MKYVRETAAGKSISAWVVMRGSREVATIQVHYADGGMVTVNAWQDSAGAERSLAAAVKAGVKVKPDANGDSPFRFQAGRAGGYGYDKLTAALSGLWVDGHKLTDHCGESRKPPRGAKAWPRDAKAPRGWHLANYRKESDGWINCYRSPGTRYLEEIGYRVIQAI